jgi:3-hydroxyacyl-[acyl-carrier-protein] dehydratase
MMAQTAVVAFGIYLSGKDLKIGTDELQKINFLFTDCQAEFFRPVKPGERVICKAERLFWRRMKLRSHAVLYNEEGQRVAEGTLSGMGVRQ